jgi:hypothetical protein
MNLRHQVFPEASLNRSELENKSTSTQVAGNTEGVPVSLILTNVRTISFSQNITYVNLKQMFYYLVL